MALGACAALVALTIYFDRKRIRFSTIAVAAVPYLAGAAGWGAYIAQNPSVFWIQFRGDATNRFISGSLIDWLRGQIIERYPYMFGFSPDTHGFSHIKIVILAIYLIGLFGALLNRRIRTDHGTRALLWMWAAASITMALADKEIHHFYLLHFLNPIIALFAIWFHSTWMEGGVPRWAMAGMLLVLVGVQFAVTASRIVQDPYRNSYRSTTAYLKEHAGSKDLIFGSAELGFDLGFFDGRLIDDFRLGYITGKKATFIVLDQNRYQEWIPNLRKSEPSTYRYIMDMLARDFQLVQQNGAYQVYARKIS